MRGTVRQGHHGPSIGWALVVESGITDRCGVTDSDHLHACCMEPPAYGFTAAGSPFHGVTCARHAVLLRTYGTADRVWTWTGA